MEQRKILVVDSVRLNQENCERVLTRAYGEDVIRVSAIPDYDKYIYPNNDPSPDQIWRDIQEQAHAIDVFVLDNYLSPIPMMWQGRLWNGYALGAKINEVYPNAKLVGWWGDATWGAFDPAERERVKRAGFERVCSSLDILVRAVGELLSISPVPKKAGE